MEKEKRKRAEEEVQEEHGVVCQEALLEVESGLAVPRVVITMLLLLLYIVQCICRSI